MLLRQLFSRRVGYAAHALCLMARIEPPAMVPVADLARQMTRTWPRTSATYLSKVVQFLVAAGIVASVRGPAGGYCLARQPATISLLDIVCALEGPLDGRCPLTPTGPCALRASCKNYSVLLQLQNDFSTLLSRITVQHLASSLTHAIEAADAHADCAHLTDSSPAPHRRNDDSDLSPTFTISHLSLGPAIGQSIG